MNAYDPTTPPPLQTQPHTSGLAMGALVCGLIALLFSWLFFLAPLVALAAIVLAGVFFAANNQSGKGLAVTGLVCGLLSLGISGSLGLWTFQKGKQIVDDFSTATTGVQSTLDSLSTNSSAIAEALPIPIDGNTVETLVKHGNEDIDAPSLENLDLGTLFETLTTAQDNPEAAVSNLASIIEGISQDQVLQEELKRLNLESLTDQIEAFGELLEE